MCFSVQVDKDIKKLAARFKATPLPHAFQGLKAMQDYERTLAGDDLKRILGLKRKPQSEVFKIPAEDGRIYPGHFAPVITMEDNKRVIRPMRYRVRPAGSSEEIPSKFNVFNARLDSLEKRQTWKPLFMHQHGLFPFLNFFEWVEDQGEKKLINFKPHNKEIMWAPCLWDFYQSPDKNISFHSFALITDEPPKEVAEKGHDRCPIFLQEDLIDEWLTPKGKSRNDVYHILNNKEDVYYDNEFI